MKFGIIENSDGTFCANCNKKLSEKEATQNYCSQCGTALQHESIQAFLKLEKAIQKDLLKQIEEALKHNDIKKIIADFKDQL